MGATYREACHSTELEAVAAMCGTEFPRTDDDSAGNVRVQSCTVIDGASITVTSVVPATAASASTTVPVSFGACDPNAHYADISEMFGLALAAIAFIYACHLAFSPLWKNT